MTRAPHPSVASPPARATSLIRGLLAILGCELAGEIAQRASGVPVPGPVLGLLLLLTLLVGSGGPWGTLQESAQGLLRYLPLMFVPAGAGVAAHAELICSELLPITAGVVGSSVIAILVTALTMRAVERLRVSRSREKTSAMPLRTADRS